MLTHCKTKIKWFLTTHKLELHVHELFNKATHFDSYIHILKWITILDFIYKHYTTICQQLMSYICYISKKTVDSHYKIKHLYILYKMNSNSRIYFHTSIELNVLLICINCSWVMSPCCKIWFPHSHVEMNTIRNLCPQHC